MDEDPGHVLSVTEAVGIMSSPVAIKVQENGAWRYWGYDACNKTYRVIVSPPRYSVSTTLVVEIVNAFRDREPKR